MRTCRAGPAGRRKPKGPPPAAPKTSPPVDACLPESAAPPAVQDLPPDHSPVDASSAAKAPKSEHDKSATNAKRQRRLLRKMLRNQRDIFKAKKLVQNLTAGRNSAAPPAPEEALLAPISRNSKPGPLETLIPKLETPLPETVTDPWLSPDLDPWLSPGIRSCPSELGLKIRRRTISTPGTRNSKPPTRNSKPILPFRKRQTRNREPNLLPPTRPPAGPMSSSKSPTATSETIPPQLSPIAAWRRIFAAAASSEMLKMS